MKTYEFLNKNIDSPKEAALDFKKSLPMIYKWMDGSATNPIDKILELLDYIDGDYDSKLINFICRKRGGHYVEDIEVEDIDTQANVSDIYKKINGLHNTIIHANEDHHFTTNELNRMDCDFYDLCRTYYQFMANHRKQLEKSKE